jgi:hypothetical protein
MSKVKLDPPALCNVYYYIGVECEAIPQGAPTPLTPKNLLLTFPMIKTIIKENEESRDC